MSKLGVSPFLPAVTLAALLSVSASPQSPESTQQGATPNATAMEDASNHVPEPPVTMPQTKPSEEEKGDTLMARKRYQAAIEAYKSEPNKSAALWNKMGIAYQLMLDPADASACYRRSLKLDKRNADVLNNLGTIYDAEKRYKDAERMYHAALHITPKSAMILKNLGTALMAEHNYKKGSAEYRAALALDPHIFENSEAPRVQDSSSLQDRGAMNYYMARGCAQAGRMDCAIDYLRMALIEGYTNPKKLAADREFAGLHGQPAFEALVTEHGAH